MDALLIAPLNADENVNHLTKLLQRLFNNRKVVNPDECELGAKEMMPFGHEIAQEGIEPGGNKMCAILDYGVLFLIKEQKFFKLAEFHRRFIPHADECQPPLTDSASNNPRDLVLAGPARGGSRTPGRNCRHQTFLPFCRRWFIPAYDYKSLMSSLHAKS